MPLLSDPYPLNGMCQQIRDMSKPYTPPSGWLVADGTNGTPDLRSELTETDRQLVNTDGDIVTYRFVILIKASGALLIL